MKTIKKLRTIFDLKTSGYGQPSPRHGLQLLYWFATECIWENGEEMFLACDPATGNFGFHQFENRLNYEGGKLLPDVGFPYYVLGNLNYDKANMLPNFVKNAADQNGLSNMDRIIVTVQEGNKFGKIYITKHSGRSNFDASATYHVSRKLLRYIIESYPKVEDFMLSVQNQDPVKSYMMCQVVTDEMLVNYSDSEEDERETEKAGMYYLHADTKPRRNSCCTIL